MVRWAIRSVGIVGGGLVTAAIAWWAIVFYGVFTNTGVPLTDTAPCLLYTSDMCSLAMSLCGGRHPFGLTRYSADLLWVGVAASSLAAVLATVGRRGGASAEE